MNDMTLNEVSASVNMDAHYLALNFRKWRRHEVKKYKNARWPAEKKAAREWVLHYGRLIRKLEAAQ